MDIQLENMEWNGVREIMKGKRKENGVGIKEIEERKERVESKKNKSGWEI